jgi:hypothetical protein
LVGCLVAFVVGALVAVLGHWYPDWAFGLTYAAVLLVTMLVATATRYLIEAHVERTAL